MREKQREINHIDVNCSRILFRTECNNVDIYRHITYDSIVAALEIVLKFCIQVHRISNLLGLYRFFDSVFK